MRDDLYHYWEPLTQSEKVECQLIVSSLSCTAILLRDQTKLPVRYDDSIHDCRVFSVKKMNVCRSKSDIRRYSMTLYPDNYELHSYGPMDGVEWDSDILVRVLVTITSVWTLSDKTLTSWSHLSYYRVGSMTSACSSRSTIHVAFHSDGCQRRDIPFSSLTCSLWIWRDALLGSANKDGRRQTRI